MCLLKKGGGQKSLFKNTKYLLMIHLDATKKVKLGLMRWLNRSMHLQSEPNTNFWSSEAHRGEKRTNSLQMLSSDRHTPTDAHIQSMQTGVTLPTYTQIKFIFHEKLRFLQMCLLMKIHIKYVYMYICAYSLHAYIYPQFYLLPCLQVIKIKTFN